MALFRNRKFLFSWMIGGAQGTGVDTSANVYAYAAAAAGYYVYGKREYYSNIKGRHSYFCVVASDNPINSIIDDVHLLVSFDAETVFRHAFEVVPGGGIIYDKDLEGERLKNIPSIEQRISDEIREELEKNGLGDTLKDVLTLAHSRNVKLFPIPYMELLKKTGELIGQTQLSALVRMLNTMAVAASFAVLRADPSNLYKGLSYSFRAKKKVVDMNVKACEVVYDYVRTNFSEDFAYSLPNRSRSDEVLLFSGTSIVGIAKIYSGCRFQTYYPITPAADESVYLEDKMTFRIATSPELEYPHIAETNTLIDKGNIVVMQTEDEIAAINMAIGAALTGVRSATATSGPGFSLMVEGLGWAGMNEVPVVVTHYQRAGPSTGLPTRHEQGDLLFSVFAGHGEFPRIVIASGDMLEAFYDTVRAFNYAEKFQVPVIHLLDKAIANATQTIKLSDIGDVVIERGEFANEAAPGEKYRRFKFTETGVSPRAILGSPGTIFWNTGDEHDEYGHIDEDPTNRTRMMNKRMGKLRLIEETVPSDEKISIYGDRSSDIWVISWGSTKGPIIDALEMLPEKYSIGFLQVRMLHPFPGQPVSDILKDGRKVIDIEQNYSGQIGKLLTMATGLKPTNYILKYNGRPFSSTEIRDGLIEVLQKDAKRVVMNRGA
ncbi:MAG: 2-oxoacid:ferredoxin oxidoreductase subunit alpha [Nitrososphaerota archaeon]